MIQGKAGQMTIGGGSSYNKESAPRLAPAVDRMRRVFHAAALEGEAVTFPSSPAFRDLCCRKLA